MSDVLEKSPRPPLRKGEWEHGKTARPRQASTALLQPGARGASLEGLLLHGLQGGLGGIDLLLDLLEGLRLLYHFVPLAPHNALLCASDSSELGQEVAPLHLRLLQPLTGRSHTLLPVGCIIPGHVKDDIALFERRSVQGLQLLLRLLQGSLQRIELLLHRQQGVPQFPNLPPLPHKERVGMHLPFAAELLKIGSTLLARRGNAPFEFGNFWCRWCGRRCGCLAAGRCSAGSGRGGDGRTFTDGVSSVADVPDPEARARAR